MAVQGSHVEYARRAFAGDEQAPAHDGVVIVRVFSSELAALRSAVQNGNRHIRVRFGQTIDEALEEADPSKIGASAAKRMGVGRKPEAAKTEAATPSESA